MKKEDLSKLIDKPVIFRIPGYNDISGKLVSGNFTTCSGREIYVEALKNFHVAIGDKPIPGNYSIRFDEYDYDTDTTYYGLLQESDLKFIIYDGEE